MSPQTDDPLGVRALLDAPAAPRGDPLGVGDLIMQGLEPQSGDAVLGALGAVGAGAVGTVGAMVEGVGILADKAGLEPDNFAVRGGQAAQRYAAGIAAGPRGRNRAAGGARKFLAETVPNAVGSTAGFAGAGALAVAAAPASLLAAGAGAGAAAVAATAAGGAGALAGVTQGYRDALAHGASEETAWTSALVNGGLGLSEAVPIGGIIGRVVKRMPREARELFMGALEEGGQEIFQAVGGDLFAKYSYDEERSALASAAENGAAGAVVGLLAAGAGLSLRPGHPTTGLPRHGPDPMGPPAPPSKERIEAEDLTPEGVAAVEAFARARNDKPESVRVFYPRPGREQKIASIAERTGARVLLYDSGEGHHRAAMYKDGHILVDANSGEGGLTEAIVLHETAHNVKAALGAQTIEEAWARISDSPNSATRDVLVDYLRFIRKVDRQDIQVRADDALAGQSAGEAPSTTPQPTRPTYINAAERADEGIANLAENLSGFLPWIMENPKAADTLIRGDRKFFEKILDSFIKAYNKVIGTRFGREIADVSTRKIADLHARIADTKFELDNDPRFVLETAREVSKLMFAAVSDDKILSRYGDQKFTPASAAKPTAPPVVEAAGGAATDTAAEQVVEPQEQGPTGQAAPEGIVRARTIPEVRALGPVAATAAAPQRPAEVQSLAQKPMSPEAMERRVAARPVARAFTQIAQRQTRYQGNKREFIKNHALLLDKLAEGHLGDVETVFDMYAGGGTYGLSYIAAGATPKAKRIVLNEVDPIRRSRLELSISDGGDFLSEWDSNPTLRDLKSQLEPLIVRSSSPAAARMDLIQMQSEFAALPQRAKAAFLALRDVMFSGRTADWERLRETAAQDADRIKRLAQRAQAQGAKVEIVSLDSLGKEATDLVSKGGRSLVLADPPYHETASGAYSAGGKTYDFGSSEFMRGSLDAALEMARGNVLVYHNNATSAVSDYATAATQGRMFGSTWSRQNGSTEFLGVYDGRSESADAESVSGNVSPSEAIAGPVQEPEVVGEAGGNPGGQAAARPEGDAGGSARRAGAAGRRLSVAETDDYADARRKRAQAELPRLSDEALAAELAANLEREARTERAVLGAAGFTAQQVRRYGELRRVARTQDNPERLSAARQLSNIRERLGPDAEARLTGLESGSTFHTEDLQAEIFNRIEPKAAYHRAKEAPTHAEEMAIKEKEKKRKATATEKLGTDERFAVAPRFKRTFAELESLAQSQEGSRKWFAEFKAFLDDFLGAHSEYAPLVAELLNVTSAATQVGGNVAIAIKALRDFIETGEFGSAYLPAHTGNLRRAVLGETPSGPKISQYSAATFGDANAKPVDRHIAQIFFGVEKPTGAQIKAAHRRLDRMAARLGWEPREVMAALWAANQVRNGSLPTTYDTYLAKFKEEIHGLLAQDRAGTQRGLQAARRIGQRISARGGPEAGVGRGAASEEVGRFAVAPRTDTPEFKRWFGDSKVVDEMEQPKPLVHETNDKFNTFEAGEFGFHFGEKIPSGMFGSRRIRAYLSIQSPLRVRDLGVFSPERVLEAARGAASAEERAAALAEVAALREKHSDALADPEQETDATILANRRATYLIGEPVRALLKAKGYDGLVYQNEAEGYYDSWVAFDSAQIKSTRNSGAFDPKNPDIRFAISKKKGELHRFPINPRNTVQPGLVEWADKTNSGMDIRRATKTEVDAYGDGAAGDWGAFDGSDLIVLVPGDLNEDLARVEIARAFQRDNEDEPPPRPKAMFSTRKPSGETLKRGTVLYHGTSASPFAQFRGPTAYLTDNKDEASAFGKRTAQVRVPRDGRVLDAVDQVNDALMEGEDMDAAIDAIAAQAKADGYDFLKFFHPSMGDGEEFAAYVSTDPQSLVPASGARFAARKYRRVAGQVNVDVARDTRTTALLLNTQDTFRSIFKLQSRLVQANGPLPEAQDTYLAQTLMRGKAKTQALEWKREYLTPLMRDLYGGRVSLARFNEYLIARHANEYRRHVQSLQPRANDIGSGMTEKQANDAMAAFAASPDIKAIEAAAAKFDKWTSAVLDYRVAKGTLSAEQAQLYRDTYDHWAPMRDMPDQEHESIGMGRGFDMRGKDKRRLGRELGHIAENPLQFMSLISAEAAINGEKAQVGQRFLNLLRAHSLGDMAKIVTAKDMMKRGLSSAGEIKAVRDMGFTEAENVVTFKEGGEDVVVQFAPEYLSMAEAFKMMGAHDLHAVVNAIGRYTRLLASLSTRQNPVFPLINFLKDAQFAGLVGSAEHGAAFGRQLISGLASSFVEIRKWQKDPLNASPLVQRWAKAGGPISFLDLNNIQKAVADTDREMRDFDGKLKSWEKIAKGWDHVFGNYADALEQVTRYSAFKAALARGMSDEQAAAISKNITVNFERKGKQSWWINSLFMFAGAGTQGAARLAFAAASNRRVQRVLGGVVAAGILVDLINSTMGGDDDDDRHKWDKVPVWTRRGNLVLMAPDGGTVKMPIPYGINWFFNLGQTLSAYGRGLASDGQHGAGLGASVGELWASGLDAFNPLGGSGTLLQTLSPSVLDPFVQMAENQGWSGKPIYPGTYGKEVPDSSLSWEDTSPVLKDFAAWLNRVTGGDEVDPGLADFSPETMKLWLSTLTGGLGQELVRGAGVGSQLLDDPSNLRADQIPLVRRIVGSPPGPERWEREWRAVGKEIDKASTRAANAEERGDSTSAGDDALSWREGFLQAKRDIDRLRREFYDIAAADPEGAAEVRASMQDAMREFVITYRQETAQAAK